MRTRLNFQLDVILFRFDSKPRFLSNRCKYFCAYAVNIVLYRTWCWSLMVMVKPFQNALFWWMFNRTVDAVTLALTAIKFQTLQSFYHDFPTVNMTLYALSLIVNLWSSPVVCKCGLNSAVFIKLSLTFREIRALK